MSFIIHTGLQARVGAPRQGRCPWEEGRLLGQLGGPASSRPFVEARGSRSPHATFWGLRLQTRHRKWLRVLSWTLLV